jgi:hypothetical protein
VVAITHNRLGNSIRRSLKSGADDEDATSNHNTPSTTEPITKEEGGQTPEQTSDFVDGDDGALKRCGTLASWGRVDFGKGGGECLSCEKLCDQRLEAEIY